MNVRLTIVTVLPLCTALWAMPGTARGQTPTPTCEPTPAQSSPGNLFVSANVGGSFNPDGGSSIFQYASDGTHIVLAPNLHAPRGLAFDSNGNLFVATNTSPDGINSQASILEITSGGLMSTFATGFPYNFFLTGLAIDCHNNIFVLGVNQTDFSQGSIFKVDASNGTVSTFFSASVPSLLAGTGLAFDGIGNLYAPATVDGVGGPGPSAIYKFPLTDTGLSNVPSTLVSPDAFAAILQGYPGEGPIDLAFDTAGNLFVSTENGNGTGGVSVVLKFPSNYDPSSLGTGVTTVATGLSRPRGLAFDTSGSGNLFVAEAGIPAPGDILEFTPGTTGADINVASHQITCDNTTVTVQQRTIHPGTNWSVAYFDEGDVTCDFGARFNRGPYNLTFSSAPVTPPTLTVTLAAPNTAAPLTTTVTLDPSAPTPPPNFELTGTPLTFDITTTTTPTPPIIVAFTVPSSLYNSTLDSMGNSTLKAMHYECPPPAGVPVDNSGCGWVDRTIYPEVSQYALTLPGDPAYPSNPAPDTIYESVNSLSPFLIAKFKYSAQVQPPIKANGTSVFKRGVVVAVKFTLTSDGVATCQLPPATISLISTAGRILSGKNFRIDSTNCQYVYNLATSSLSTGTYQVNILIGGSVAGTATFALK